MTITDFINKAKKSVASKTDVVIAATNAQLLEDLLVEAKTNKLVVQSLMNLMLIENIDDDKLVDSITDMLQKNNLLTVEKTTVSVSTSVPNVADSKEEKPTTKVAKKKPVKTEAKSA